MTIYVRTSHFQHEPGLIIVIFQGLVPGGTSVVLNAPNGATQYVWTAASIPAGTSVIFVMSDAQNRTGGVSDILVSNSTGSASCLNANSPSVTQQSTSSTQTPSSSSSSATASASKSNKISGLTLAAAIAGTLVFIGVVAALGVFLLRRCRKKSSRRRTADFIVDGKAFEVVCLLLPRVDACTGYQDSPSLVHHAMEPFPAIPSNITPPYEMTRMDNSAASLLRPTSDATGQSPSPSPLPTTSAGSRKANMAPTTRNQPAQFILHTDVEETEPDENGFIELPPQYSASRRPLAPYGSENGAQSSSYIP